MKWGHNHLDKLTRKLSEFFGLITIFNRSLTSQIVLPAVSLFCGLVFTLALLLFQSVSNCTSTRRTKVEGVPAPPGNRPLWFRWQTSSSFHTKEQTLFWHMPLGSHKILPTAKQQQPQTICCKFWNLQSSKKPTKFISLEGSWTQPVQQLTDAGWPDHFVRHFPHLSLPIGKTIQLQIQPETKCLLPHWCLLVQSKTEWRIAENVQWIQFKSHFENAGSPPIPSNNAQDTWFRIFWHFSSARQNWGGHLFVGTKLMHLRPFWQQYNPDEPKQNSRHHQLWSLVSLGWKRTQLNYDTKPSIFWEYFTAFLWIWRLCSSFYGYLTSLPRVCNVLAEQIKKLNGGKPDQPQKISFGSYFACLIELFPQTLESCNKNCGNQMSATFLVRRKLLQKELFVTGENFCVNSEANNCTTKNFVFVCASCGSRQLAFLATSFMMTSHCKYSLLKFSWPSASFRS